MGRSLAGLPPPAAVSCRSCFSKHELLRGGKKGDLIDQYLQFRNLPHCDLEPQSRFFQVGVEAGVFSLCVSVHELHKGTNAGLKVCFSSGEKASESSSPCQTCGNNPAPASFGKRTEEQKRGLSMKG